MGKAWIAIAVPGTRRSRNDPTLGARHRLGLELQSGAALESSE